LAELLWVNCLYLVWNIPFTAKILVTVKCCPTLASTEPYYAISASCYLSKPVPNL
jgi:hypothetical protein